MVEGPSGLLAVAKADEEMVWWPTKGVVTFASGAEAFVYSAGAPESLRGPRASFRLVRRAGQMAAGGRRLGQSEHGTAARGTAAGDRDDDAAGGGDPASR